MLPRHSAVEFLGDCCKKNGISPCGMPVSAAAAGVSGVREAERNIFGKYAHKRQCVFILRKKDCFGSRLRNFRYNSLKHRKITVFFEELYKLLFIRTLKTQKIQGMYFKIKGTYFKIHGL